jgi:hypothetical protein
LSQAHHTNRGGNVAPDLSQQPRFLWKLHPPPYACEPPMPAELERLVDGCFREWPRRAAFLKVFLKANVDRADLLPDVVAWLMSFLFHELLILGADTDVELRVLELLESLVDGDDRKLLDDALSKLWESNPGWLDNYWASRRRFVIALRRQGVHEGTLAGHLAVDTFDLMWLSLSK